MNHIVDDERCELSRAMTGAINNIYSPAPREDQSLQEAIKVWSKEERLLAEKYGMSTEAVDSVEVHQEARARGQSKWRRFTCALYDLCHNTNTLELNSAAAADMHGLYHLREEYGRVSRPLLNVENSHQPIIQGAPHRVDASRFWAVLIGIDAYENSPLNGCVSDAILMKEFLINDLGVPEQRIQCLFGSHNPIPDDALTPSRANIVNTLLSLIQNGAIRLGDNIIIYYAGHGSSYHCLNHTMDQSVCPIEALCPIDRDNSDSQGGWVPDISDRELNAILTEISRIKGHKITFIADCCHASGSTRNLETGQSPRSIPICHHTRVDEMFRAADERLKSFPYYRSVVSKDWKPDMSSHVIVAACREYQSAVETRERQGYRGVLTKILVSVLRSGAWKKETTYIGLANLLNHSYSQTPAVAGDHKDECLWYPESV